MNSNIQYITTMIIIFSSLLISSVIILSAQAQVDPNDRFFIKSFCANEDTLLSDQRYINGEELSYDSTGCPESIKVIHRWNELSIADQNLITNRMTVNGYMDRTVTMIAQSR